MNNVGSTAVPLVRSCAPLLINHCLLRRYGIERLKLNSRGIKND